MRSLLLTVAFAFGLLTALPAAESGIEVRELASPASASAVGPSFAPAADGTLWLSWVETTQDARVHAPHAHGQAAVAGPANTLRFATFDPETNSWREAGTIAQASTVMRSGLDAPQLAIDGAGVAHALWTDGHGGALITRSRDGGKSWDSPSPWTRGSNEVEKFSLVRLANGRVLVAWLDGRARATGGARQQLFARYIDAPDGTEQRIDASVCDCCQTVLTAFLDGGALVAYRGRTDDEIRDILTARFRDDRWEGPRPLHADGWKINACPVNGPRLAADAGRVSAAWFTGADNESKVFASYSPDAGTRWLEPLRIDRGHPAGHVDTAILRDSALIVTWLEGDGSLWLARITPEFELTPAVQLAPAKAAAIHAVPRLAVLRDYDGEKSTAELLIAYTTAGDRPELRTIRVTIAEGSLLADERSCGCTPTAEQLESIPIRGRVLSVDPTHNSVAVTHPEIPGVFAAGRHEFRVTPALLAEVRTGGEFLGNVIRRDGAWQLTEIRWLASR